MSCCLLSKDTIEFKHDNTLRFLVDHPTIGPTELEGLFHFILIWTMTTHIVST